MRRIALTRSRTISVITQTQHRIWGARRGADQRVHIMRQEGSGDCCVRVEVRHPAGVDRRDGHLVVLAEAGARYRSLRGGGIIPAGSDGRNGGCRTAMLVDISARVGQTQQLLDGERRSLRHCRRDRFVSAAAAAESGRSRFQV